jgi:hypothetical protein
VEDDAVWVDGNTTRLDEVEASTGDAPHQRLQGDPAIIAIDRNLVSQSWITSPDDPHVKVSPAIGVQRPRAVGLVTRNADVVESLRKADAGPVSTLGLELQGHGAAEAVQEGSRRAGPVKGGGTTETARSPAGSRVAAGVSGIIVVIIFVEIWRQRVAAHVSRGLVHVGMQTNGLHRGGVVGISANAVVEGLPTATETTAKRTVAVGIVHRWGLVAHYREDGVVRIVSGGEGVSEGGRKGGDEGVGKMTNPFLNDLLGAYYAFISVPRNPQTQYA